MDIEALLAPDASVPLGQSRARVLDLLRAAGSPLGVQEVAGHAGLHPNTARFHLDGLAEAGLATREPSSAHCTWGSCRARWPRCGLRSPRAGWTRSQNRVCAWHT